MRLPHAPSSIRLLTCVMLIALRLQAEDTPTEPAKGPEEAKDWVFNPTPGRPDVFYDYQSYLTLTQSLRAQDEENETAHTGIPTINPNQATNETAIELGKETIVQLDLLLGQHKYEDAEKIADAALKKLEPFSSNADINHYIERIKADHDLAEDALMRVEAEESFDSLGLKVEGILWSENGTRLALIAGEPHALAVNDRVKDCVIVVIDTDRVEFRYHYKRKRFEFPRYVGEDSTK